MERGLADSPPPYPHGWFAAAFSSDIRPGTILTRKFMGRDIVVYRTKSGRLCASEAYCPHLGAHLGHGGRICGEAIECPFHGFRFGTDGNCVSTPYAGGMPPPAARLATLPVRECFGMVMVYHGASGEPPWEIEVSADDGGWRPLQKRKLRFHSHPQEVTENAVDYGHFGGVHNMGNFGVVTPLTIDGPRLRVTYRADKPVPITGAVSGCFDIRVDGLGYSIVEVSLNIGWTFRQLVLTTPTVGREVDAFLAVSVRRSRHRLVSLVLAPLERAWGRLVLELIVLELARDRKMWDHKKYLSKPALAGGDGPIGKYRRWARQFYPELRDGNDAE
ncbi:Rieske 2Fe-2S domain-containing protein [Nocardia sp. NPDC051832]|uniref:Rieske 2Fe-2S domain-containing protein n=1 Tax=Nocardia sp. NPDC051832 TaxID=3155673 RepID=UPI0034391A96